MVTKKNAHFLKAQAEDVEISEKLVEVSAINSEGKKEHFYLPYDKLVIGVGMPTPGNQMTPMQTDERQVQPQIHTV